MPESTSFSSIQDRIFMNCSTALPCRNPTPAPHQRRCCYSFDRRDHSRLKGNFSTLALKTIEFLLDPMGSPRQTTLQPPGVHRRSGDPF